MHSEPRALFLLLRRVADMDRASGDVTAHLSTLRRRSTASAAEAIRAIWIDEQGVAQLPFTLSLPDVDGGCRGVRALETTLPCRLGTAAGTVPREGLVAVLLVHFHHETTGTATRTARFVPGFTRKTPHRRAGEEVRALKSRHPGLVLPPVHLGGDGALRLPPAQPRSRGAA